MKMRPVPVLLNYITENMCSMNLFLMCIILESRFVKIFMSQTIMVKDKYRDRKSLHVDKKHNFVNVNQQDFGRGIL